MTGTKKKIGIMEYNNFSLSELCDNYCLHLSFGVLMDMLFVTFLLGKSCTTSSSMLEGC